MWPNIATQISDSGFLYVGIVHEITCEMTLIFEAANLSHDPGNPGKMFYLSDF